MKTPPPIDPYTEDRAFDNQHAYLEGDFEAWGEEDIKKSAFGSFAKAPPKFKNNGLQSKQSSIKHEDGSATPTPYTRGGNQ
jgi:hypothetical protein